MLKRGCYEAYFKMSGMHLSRHIRDYAGCRNIRTRYTTP